LNLRQLLLNVGMPFITLFQEKDVELVIDIDPKLDELVYADDLRLIQVFNNLFSNALKFTEKGFVRLNVACTEKNENQIKASFSVEDSGIGIEEKNQERIFESFWQVYDEDTKKFVGTGLGLTICVRLLKLMGGNLTLVSKIGVGSEFRFDLAFKCADKAISPAKSPAEAKDNLSGVRILIAEDNQLNMMIVSRMLTGFKANITMAYNGQEALDILEKDPAYDIILMDLEMPVMTGYTAVYEVKRLYPKIPVIAFTASLVDEKMMADLIASGFSDCMLKPFQPHQMLTSIKKYLLKPPALAVK
jgi:CheY-like chemotaxis protein